MWLIFGLIAAKAVLLARGGVLLSRALDAQRDRAVSGRDRGTT